MMDGLECFFKTLLPGFLSFLLILSPLLICNVHKIVKAFGVPADYKLIRDAFKNDAWNKEQNALPDNNCCGQVEIYFRFHPKRCGMISGLPYI